MAYDGELIEGWEKYGQLGGTLNISATTSGEWNSWFGNNAGNPSATLIPSLQGPGLALYITGAVGYTGVGTIGPLQALSNNYARVVGTMYFQTTLGNSVGVTYMDGATQQASVGVQATTGRPFFTRGDMSNGTVLATGSLAAAANSIHCLQCGACVCRRYAPRTRAYARPTSL